jgi:hypothetical protein
MEASELQHDDLEFHLDHQHPCQRHQQRGLHRCGSEPATTLVAIAGTPTANQNNGNNAPASASATSDRVIATAPSSVTGSGIQLQMTNGTGATLTGLNIAFDTVRFAAVSSANELPGYWVFISTDGTSWTNVTPNPTITTVPNTVGVTATTLTADRPVHRFRRHFLHPLA